MTREEAIEVYHGFLNQKIKEAFEVFAPELRESEDEKIRKEIISALKFANDGGVYDKHIAYLEKQKEQKPVEKENTLTDFEEVLNLFLFDFANSPIEDCEPKEYIQKHSAEILKAAYKELNAKLQQDIFEAKQEGRREGYEVARAEQKPITINQNEKEFLADEITAFLCNYDKEFDDEDPVPSEVAEHFYLLGKQAQKQKPVEWSEEDKAIIGCIVCCLDGQFVTEAARKQCLEWFNKHRRDFLNQPKPEWNEEDKHRCKDAICFLETAKKHYADTSEIELTIDWLKSLRPQPKDKQEQPEMDLDSRWPINKQWNLKS